MFGLSVRATSEQHFIYVEKKTKWRIDLPEGFACHIPRQWDQYLGEWHGLFQVVWRTDFEVDLERAANYCVGLWALYLRMIILIQLFDDVLSLRRTRIIFGISR